MPSNRRSAVVRLPPFSSLPRTPSPPSTPVTPTFSFRVGTPPSYTRSPQSACFPVSPTSPTSYSGSPRPPVGSLSLGARGAGHPRGGISKASRHRGPGLPTIAHADIAKYHRPEEKAPQRAGGSQGDFPLTVKIRCKWRMKGEEDCTWTWRAVDYAKWKKHLGDHRTKAGPSETSKDGRVRCGWGGCRKRMTESGWLNHIRRHDPNFWKYCRCSQRVTIPETLE
jgi:hypothetical protein